MGNILTNLMQQDPAREGTHNSGTCAPSGMDNLQNCMGGRGPFLQLQAVSDASLAADNSILLCEGLSEGSTCISCCRVQAPEHHVD